MSAPISDEEMATIALFEGLDADQRRTLARLATERACEDGAVIVREGEHAEALFVVREGRVRIEKADAVGERYRIATLGRGEAFGEIGLVDDQPASATVRADGPARVLCLALRGALDDPAARSLRAGVLENLARLLAARLRSSSAATVTALRAELEQMKLGGRTVVALVLVSCACMLGTALLHALPAAHRPGQTWISTGSILVGAGFMYGLLRFGREPLAVYGLTLRNIGAHAREAALFTLPVLALLTAIKWAWLRSSPSLQGEPLFRPGAMFGGAPFHAGPWLLALVVYAALTPLQEFYYRAGLQGALRRILPPPRAPGGANWSAIVVANLVFASVHTYIGVWFALAVLPPGMLWGWLYERQRSIVGPSVSHVLVGVFALFVLGMQVVVGGR